MGKINDLIAYRLSREKLIKLNNFKIDEVHSKFVNRERGESSLNFKLILESFIGLIKLYLKKRKLEYSR